MSMRGKMKRAQEKWFLMLVQSEIFIWLSPTVNIKLIKRKNIKVRTHETVRPLYNLQGNTSKVKVTWKEWDPDKFVFQFFYVFNIFFKSSNSSLIEIYFFILSQMGQSKNFSLSQYNTNVPQKIKNNILGKLGL